MKISRQPPRSRGTTLRDYDVIFRQVNWRLRSSDRVRTHDDLTYNTKGFADAWTCEEVCNHVMSSQVM